MDIQGMKEPTTIIIIIFHIIMQWFVLHLQLKKLGIKRTFDCQHFFRFFIFTGFSSQCMHSQYKLSIIHMAQCFVDNIIYGQLYSAVFGRLFHSPLSMFTACLWGNFLIVWSESSQLDYRDCQSRGIFYSVKGLAGQYLMEALKYGLLPLVSFGTCD